MSTVAVTGATGHLGQVLVPYLWERGHIVEQVGRWIHPDLEADVVIHAAAPNWRNEDAIKDFARFNEAVARWAEVTGGRVISIGSWWQYADGIAPHLSYSRMKNDQQEMFPLTVVPFSVYGTTERDDSGFIPQLRSHVRGTARLVDASPRTRDWIHVRAVCDALRAALVAPDGIYEANTGIMYSPADLVRAMTGETLPGHVDVPTASPRYLYPRVPNWSPRIDVLTHLRTYIPAA